MAQIWWKESGTRAFFFFCSFCSVLFWVRAHVSYKCKRLMLTERWTTFHFLRPQTGKQVKSRMAKIVFCVGEHFQAADIAERSVGTVARGAGEEANTNLCKIAN